MRRIEVQFTVPFQCDGLNDLLNAPRKNKSQIKKKVYLKGLVAMVTWNSLHEFFTLRLVMTSGAHEQQIKHTLLGVGQCQFFFWLHSEILVRVWGVRRIWIHLHN